MAEQQTTQSDSPEIDPQKSERERIAQLINEVNTLAEQVRQSIPNYTPPPYSPQAMAILLKERMQGLATEGPIGGAMGVLGDLKNNLEGTKPEDLLNPDTWKGLWYIMNYSIQAQTDPVKEKMLAQLAQLPGGTLLLDLKSSFEGAKPSDLLDINTWKGAFYILDHTIRSQAKEVKKKLLGEGE